MLNDLRDQVHQNAVEHGWWEKEKAFGEIIALCHSELSEALEEYRDNTPYPKYSKCNKCGAIDIKSESICCGEIMKPEGVAIELADVIIRILDYCGRIGIDIDEAIRVKHEFNKTRPYKHGGKII